jgi:hypothetical protein
MPRSVRTRPSQLSAHSILRAKALPGISGYLSMKSTHGYIFYLRRCKILSGLLWRSVEGRQNAPIIANNIAYQIKYGYEKNKVSTESYMKSVKKIRFILPQSAKNETFILWMCIDSDPYLIIKVRKEHLFLCAYGM